MFTESVTMPAWFFLLILLALLAFAVDCMYSNFKIGPRRDQKQEPQCQHTSTQLPSSNSLDVPETSCHEPKPTSTSLPDINQPRSDPP